MELNSKKGKNSEEQTRFKNKNVLRFSKNHLMNLVYRAINLNFSTT